MTLREAINLSCVFTVVYRCFVTRLKRLAQHEIKLKYNIGYFTRTPTYVLFQFYFTCANCFIFQRTNSEMLKQFVLGFYFSLISRVRASEIKLFSVSF